MGKFLLHFNKYCDEYSKIRIISHSLDGSAVYGPPLNNIYMNEITVVRNGKEHTLNIDRKYLMRAINNPAYEKRLAYRYKEIPHAALPEEEAEMLVEYLMAISSEGSTK